MTSPNRAMHPLFKLSIILILAFGLWYSYNSAKIVLNSTVEQAKIVGCDSKVTTRSGGSNQMNRQNVTVYAPIAVSENKNKAIGSIWTDRAICKNMIGNDTYIYVDKDDPEITYINSFLQFWMFPSFLAYLIIIAFASKATPKLTPLLTLGFLAIAGFYANKELNFIDLPFGAGGKYGEIADSDNMGKSNDISTLSLNACVRASMAEKGIKERVNLTYLICHNSSIEDLGSISDLINLEELYLQGNSLSSLETMPSFNKLRRISVAGNKTLTALKGVERLPALEELQMNKSAISDLSGVETLKNLKIVGLMMNKISDVSAFANLDKLEDITLSYNNISDLSAFANKPNLKSFTIYTNDITDITALYGNANMKIVGVSGRGNIPCSQIYEIRKRLAPDAKVYGPKSCD